jgi:hypothetical protein
VNQRRLPNLYQFKVTLHGIPPQILGRIQVWWDLCKGDRSDDGETRI